MSDFIGKLLSAVITEVLVAIESNDPSKMKKVFNILPDDKLKSRIALDYQREIARKKFKEIEK
jgi:hypothetical protein